MNIVIEGIDATGKSTLGKSLANLLDMTFQPGEGPPKSPSEIGYRTWCYLGKDNTVFDRHPAVSDPIYGKVRGTCGINPSLIEEFYDSKPFFIYCYPTLPGLSGHVRKEHDSDEHIQMVERNYQALLALYSEWAKKHAHMWYTIGDDVSEILGRVQSWRTDNAV